MGKRFDIFLLSIVIVLSMTSSVMAQTPSCNKLTGKNKVLAEELLEGQYPYDCCDDTISNCLKKTPTCSLVIRLAENICGRVANGENKKSIIRNLSNRASSMLNTRQKASIDLTGLPAAGDPNAPVTLVEYACPRCPFCSRSTPAIYQSVVKGALKGKVKLYFKTFPLRSHPYSKETGLAFVASARLGRFWDYILYFYNRYDEFSAELITDWAEQSGLDKRRFEKTMNDASTRERLIASKKEGIVNRVDATPTFFINGRKYTGDLRIEELIDVLEEEYERIKGIHYRDITNCRSK